MSNSHIKASEIEVGSFYLSANTILPYVREVTDIVGQKHVMYNDYDYETGELCFISRNCGKSRFASWARRKLTKEEAARMRPLKKLSLPGPQGVILLMTSPYGLKRLASMLALAVRNEVEDFHSHNTEQTIKDTDKYMPEFNNLLRNAVYTGLYAILDTDDDPRAKQYAAFIARVPEYWEEPELSLEDSDPLIDGE